MRIGLTGAHRTGKSALARRVAGKMGIDFIASPVSAIAKRYGFDMDQDRRHSPEFFIMQCEILDTLEKSFEGLSSFVADRTPIDAAAYLIADVQANTGDEKFQQAVLRYVDRAIAATERLFDVVILLPPAIEFDPVDGKPGANLAYQEHHHLVCRGLHADLNIKAGRIQRDNTDMDNRVASVMHYVRPSAPFVVTFGEAKLSPKFAQALAAACEHGVTEARCDDCYGTGLLRGQRSAA